MAISKLLPWRQSSGVLEGLYGHAPHYVTLRKRVLKEAEHWQCKEIEKGFIFTLKYAEAKEYFIDSTGLACDYSGEWRTVRFNRRRVKDWYKLHIVYDENGKIAAITLTEGNVNDSAVFEELIKNLPPGSKV